MQRSKLSAKISISADVIGDLGSSWTLVGLTRHILTRGWTGFTPNVSDLDAAVGVFRLTTDGAMFWCAAREVLAAADRVLVHAQTFRDGEVGRLRIGATPQVMQTVLAPSRALSAAAAGLEAQFVEEGNATDSDVNRNTVGGD